MLVEFLKFLYRLLKRIQLKSKNIVISGKARFNRKTIFGGYNVIHPGVIVSNTDIGKGTYIGENSKLSNCKIGKFCCISSDVEVISYTHPTKDFVSIHPAFFSTKKQCGMTFVDDNIFEEHLCVDNKYDVLIGNDVWIGTDVKIIGGIRIGNGAIIATGAVVTNNVPPYAIIGGVPAKILKYRFTPFQIEKLENIEWWNKTEKWLKDNSKYFNSIDNFLIQKDE